MKSYNNVPDLREKYQRAHINFPKAGDVVHCERCDAPVYKYLQDQQIGIPLYQLGNIEFIGRTPDAGEIVACEQCGNDLINPLNVKSRT